MIYSPAFGKFMLGSIIELIQKARPKNNEIIIIRQQNVSPQLIKIFDIQKTQKSHISVVNIIFKKKSP